MNFIQETEPSSVATYLFYIVASFCTCFNEHHIEFLGLAFTFVYWDLSEMQSTTDNKILMHILQI